MKNNHKYIWFGNLKSGIKISLVLTLFFLGCQAEKSSIVLWVNDMPVTTSEFEFQMLRNKAEVTGYFYRKHKISDSDIFWISSFQNESPLEMLKKLALEDAIKCKVQQQLAIKKGVSDNFDFDEMIKEMEAVNLERKQKVQLGEVVYGPVSFTPRTYFDYVFDQMVYELKYELSLSELKPGQKELELMQKSLEFPASEIAGFLTMQYVDLNYNSFIDSLMNAANIKINQDVIAEIGVNN